MVLQRLARIAPSREWLTGKEVAYCFAVTPRCVHRWCRLGRIRAEKRGPTLWMISREDAVAFWHDCQSRIAVPTAPRRKARK